MRLVPFTEFNSDGTTKPVAADTNFKVKEGIFLVITINVKGQPNPPVQTPCRVITFNDGNTVNVQDTVAALCAAS